MDFFFWYLKALGLKPIMMDKVRSISCIVAKVLLFINHWFNSCQKLEVMVKTKTGEVSALSQPPFEYHVL